MRNAIATKKGKGLSDYRLEYKGFECWINKECQGSWGMSSSNGYGMEDKEWGVSLPTVKMCKQFFINAVESGDLQKTL